MDKYEYKLRSDEIRELIAQGEYAEAAQIADTIDWRRVKSVMMLCTISDLYKINRRYEDSRDMLLLAYDRHPGGRTIVYSLCELSIKMGDVVQAVEYYKEFVQVAPKDSGRYILQYKLYEAQDVSLEERIAVLEELKKRDYREKWAYELAYLYHRVGLATRCVEECDELILWFGEGKYVVKAMELKMLHHPLTPVQQEKYESRFPETRDKNASPVRQEEAAVTEEYAGDTVSVDEPTKEIPAREVEIQVQTMDVHNKFNTINLQKELAESMREFMTEPEGTETFTSDFEPEPAFTDVQDTVPEAEEEDAAEEIQPEEVPLSEEVFFGETGEIGEVDVTASAVMEQLKQESVSEEPSFAEESEFEEYDDSDESEEAVQPRLVPADDGMLEIKLKTDTPSPTVEEYKPSAFEKILGMEYDGQISLVVPESEKVEKQITGQIRIEDVLLEWERMKKESEQKRMEAVRQRVLEQTGNLFTEFDAAVRDGLLEKLESKTESGTDEELLEVLSEAGEQTEENLEEVTEELQEEGPDEEFAELEEEAVEEAEEALEAEAFTEEVDEEPAEEPVDEEPAEESAEDFAEDFTEDIAEDLTEDTAAAEPEDTIETAAAEFTVEEYPEEEYPEEDIPEVPEETSPHTEPSPIRSLTRDERDLFGSFVQSRHSREQLVQVIDTISLASYTGNVIVTGEEGTDTLTLAKNLVKNVQMTDHNFSGKMAKITGSALNSKDIASTMAKMENGALIITKAADMTPATVGRLTKALQQENHGLIVVLEGTAKAMNKLLKDNHTLEESFTARFDLEALDNRSLAEFGRKYARELEYAVDDLGMLALHTRIADMQTSEHAVTIAEVKEIVDYAIARADRKSISHFFDILLAKRYNEDDMIILREKDFI